MGKIRLDQLLLEKGLFSDLKTAQARIMSGDIIVNDHRADKASDKFLPDVDIRVRGKGHEFVSRGGLKLEHAIATWGGPIKDAICIDVGASTGGFTEVLLKNGAKKVYAVEVGYGQLAEKLRQDARVVSLERTNILDLTLDEKPEIAVIDASFISLEKILGYVVSLLAKDFVIYALIKPQFEVDPKFLRKGIVKDEAIHAQVVEKISDFIKNLGLKVLGVEKSPILGAKGNVEFLVAISN